jgi:hypothetical protein
MDIYERNIEALGKTHPHLVEMVEATWVEKEKIVISHLPSGELQATYRNSNGQEIVINDSHDLSNLPKKAAELLEQKDQRRIILLLGFGLGGYAEVLHTRLKDDGILVVYEAVPEFFKATLQERDYSSLLESDRFKMILGEETEDFGFINKYHRKIAQRSFYILKQSGCVALNKPAYDKFRAKITDVKRLSDSGVVTGIARGGEWADAFIRNIPIVLSTPGVIRLKNIFQERPAIVVSAGPSIEKNLHLLARAKGRAIIIAVDVVVPTLLPAGIIPDFIVALEANRKLFRAFENNPLLRFCPLICTPEVDYETMTSLYPGPVFLNPAIQHRVLKWFENAWENKGFVATPGGSVSHMAFTVAEYMGASVIALMGQDLSFREKLHAGDATHLFYSENDVEEYRRKNPVVKDIFGEDRYTMNQFLSFRTAFEKIFKSYKGTVINSTEGGVPIKGARTMRLRDFLDEYCQITPINSFETVLSLGELQTKYELPDLIVNARDTVTKLEKVRKSAAKIIECVVRLKTLKERNMLKTGEAVGLIRKIERQEKIVEHPILSLIAPYRYRMETYLRRDNVENESFDALQDSLDYYGELIRVIEQITVRLDALQKTLERESEANDILADGMIPAIEKFYRAGVIHSEMGMVREAVRNFEQAANEFSKITEPDAQKKLWTLALSIHWLLAGLYVKQHRLYEAKDILRVLINFAPNSYDKGVDFNGASVTSLIEACTAGIARWEKQQVNMKKLLEKASKDYGSYLESGNFYLRVRDYERAKDAYSKAVEEERASFGKDKRDDTGDSIRTARLVASFFGLAQTYLAMKDVEKAIQALDMGSSYALEMDEMAGDHGSEIRSLIADLYERCGKSKKTGSLSAKTATI